jgi:hypothetical protein
MNPRVILSLLCLGFVGLLRADPTPPPSAPALDTKVEKKTELEKRMGRVGKAYKKLKKQVADPGQNPSSVLLVEEMRTAMGEALDLTPARAQDIPEADRPKFIEDYKKGIQAMLDKFSGLEDALKANDNAGAQAIIAKIGPMMKEDHKQFQRPD